jgi:hypothetical protein
MAVAYENVDPAYRPRTVAGIVGISTARPKAFMFTGQRPGLLNLPPVEVTVLSGDEFGADLTPIQLARAADRRLRRLQHGPGLGNKDTGFTFTINRAGRKKMGDNAEQAPAESMAVAGLEGLVRNAILAERHADLTHQNPGVAAVLRLYAPAEIGGRLYRVKLTAKEYADRGVQQRLHALAAVEIENAPPGIFPSYSGDNSLRTGQPTTGRTLSIAQLLHGATLTTGEPLVR